MPPTKIQLAHLPTPLQRVQALDGLVGCEVWVKRDDMTAGAEAGNKIRKLEYLLADALEQGASTVITCGGLQSNHARATTLLCRRLALAPCVFLRTASPPGPTPVGNWFLNDLAGADIHFITPAQYADRNAIMREHAEHLTAAGERAYVIPEGGSNGLGALGYVNAMHEVRTQLDNLPDMPKRFDAVVFACGSGGTAAGVALGAARWNIADRAYAMAVCDDRSYFQLLCEGLMREARQFDSTLGGAAELVVEDRFKGPAYGVASDAQRDFIRRVARTAGLVLDPVYSGKALFALAQLEDKPRRALFIHTGGLPGLLADANTFVDNSS